jgi:acyl-CoA synthetase (AMP-forming)/AMP-acid ligase II
VAELFLRSAAEAPDLAAFQRPDGTPLSFGDLAARVHRISAGAARFGLRPGDRAIVMIPMSADLYAVLLGLLSAGIVAVFVDPWVGARRIARFSAFAQPRGYFGVPRAHLLRWAEAELRRVPVSVTTGRRFLHWPARRTLAELERGPGQDRVHDASPEDPALVTFTTGSSGTPKGADRTHGFLAAQHAALRTEFPPEPGDVDLTMFPVFALNNLALGVTTVIPRLDFRRVAETDGEGIVAQMRAHGVTTCTASPPFLDRVAEAVVRHPERRPALRRILSGGAPVSDAQLRAWRAAFPDTRITVVYGSTEAEPVAHIDAEERLDAAPDRAAAPRRGYCVGRPSALVRTRVVPVERGPLAHDVADVPAGGVGELLVTGDHVCRRYFRNEAAERENKLVDADGRVWHRMGDTGSFDAEGRFWLVGRVHSTIRRAGELVPPQLVEQVAAEGDASVHRVAALGRPAAADEQQLLLVVQAVGDASADAVADAVRRRAAGAGFPPDDVRVTHRPLPVDPRHASKIDYEALHRALDRGEFR